MLLEEKVIVVTGAGPGMGQAMCRGAAAEGAKVVVSARSREAIEAVAAEIAAEGGEAIACVCDVTDPAACDRLASAAIERWGRIDGLVNSAFYNPEWAPSEAMPIEEFERAYDVIALGGLRMAQAVIPKMKIQGKGSIVNVSTVATRKGMPGAGPYAMAKAALNQLTRQLAVELAGTGIRVNSALMGSMMGATLRNYMLTHATEADAAAYFARRGEEIPVGRIPPDSDCAKAVYFLLSDLASEITGAALDVNGGDWVAP